MWWEILIFPFIIIGSNEFPKSCIKFISYLVYVCYVITPIMNFINSGFVAIIFFFSIVLLNLFISVFITFILYFLKKFHLIHFISCKNKFSPHTFTTPLHNKAVRKYILKLIRKPPAEVKTMLVLTEKCLNSIAFSEFCILNYVDEGTT